MKWGDGDDGCGIRVMALIVVVLALVAWQPRPPTPTPRQTPTPDIVLPTVPPGTLTPMAYLPIVSVSKQTEVVVSVQTATWDGQRCGAERSSRDPSARITVRSAEKVLAQGYGFLKTYTNLDYSIEVESARLPCPNDHVIRGQTGNQELWIFYFH